MSSTKPPPASAFIGRDVGRDWIPPEGAVVELGEVQPNVWPACSTCDAAYHRELCLTLGHGPQWLWVRSCRHRAADYTLRTTIEGGEE